MEPMKDICQCGRTATIQLVNGVMVCEECYIFIRQEIESVNKKLNEKD